MKQKSASRRIHELDLLRGFFIVVILLDHLQFWPSPWQYITGQGRLWVSAAEGFFLISGLLIGYLRAHRGARIPLLERSKLLWKRAALLYVWGVGITFVVVALSVLLPDDTMLPKLPDSTQVSSLTTYVANVVSTAYASDWIYFLRLYAFMLAATPLFLWLIGKRKWWLAALISAGIYALSLGLMIEEAAMQWQVLFFGAALIGWKLDTILAWLRQRPRLRRTVLTTLIVSTLGTMLLSYFMVHGWSYVENPATSISRDAYVSIRAEVDPLFSNNPLVPLRITLSYVWFTGLLALFHVSRQWLMRYAAWLLLPFGQASLTAYCLQAIVLCFIVSYVPIGNFWYNGLIGVGVILLHWWLIKRRHVRAILPQ